MHLIQPELRAQQPNPPAKFSSSYLQGPTLSPTPVGLTASSAGGRACFGAWKPDHDLQVQVTHGAPCKTQDDFGTGITELGFLDFQNWPAIPHHDSSVLTPLSSSSASAVKWKMVSEKIRIKLLKHLDTFKRIAEHRSTQD